MLLIRETVIVESLKEGLEKIKDYFERYNPRGYGTTAHVSVDIQGVIIEFSRYASCE